MHTFSFKDINIDDDTVIRGNSEEEVLEKGMSRLRADHGDKFEELQAEMSEEELKELIRDNINEE